MKKVNKFALALSIITTSTALGVDRSVSDLIISLDDWQLVPTLIGTKVESFVGICDPAIAVGSNITAVWFLRTDDNQWQTFAWYEPDNIKAIAHIKSTLGLDDSMDVNWPDPEAQQGVDPAFAEAPSAFATSVFVADPFAAVINSLEEPTTFIETLTELGWSAADIPIQIGNSSFTQNENLSTLAAMVEADIATDANGETVASFTLDPNREEWISLTIPLGPEGTWATIDFSQYLEVTASIDPGDAWQSIAVGTVYTGPQSIVIEAGGTDENGVQFVTTHFVVRLKDVTAPSIQLDISSNSLAPLVSPGGLKYFIAPASVSADIVAYDNVDGLIDIGPNPESILIVIN